MRSASSLGCRAGGVQGGGWWAGRWEGGATQQTLEQSSSLAWGGGASLVPPVQPETHAHPAVGDGGQGGEQGVRLLPRQAEQVAQEALRGGDARRQGRRR